jgi:hypothetical protein
MPGVNKANERRWDPLLIVARALARFDCRLTTAAELAGGDSPRSDSRFGSGAAPRGVFLFTGSVSECLPSAESKRDETRYENAQQVCDRCGSLRSGVVRSAGRRSNAHAVGAARRRTPARHSVAGLWAR